MQLVMLAMLAIMELVRHCMNQCFVSAHWVITKW